MLTAKGVTDVKRYVEHLKTLLHQLNRKNVVLITDYFVTGTEKFY